MKKTLKSLLSLLLIFTILYSFEIIVFADSVQELAETAEEAVTYDIFMTIIFTVI